MKTLCKNKNNWAEKKPMWEDERRKTVTRNIIIGLLLVTLVAGLGVAMRKVMKQIEQEDRRLSAIKQEQQQQLNDNRQSNIDAIQHAYETDMETVAAYLPGVVCWGDSLTAGTSGNVS